jgi:hypothetical protein
MSTGLFVVTDAITSIGNAASAAAARVSVLTSNIQTAKAAAASAAASGGSTVTGGGPNTGGMGSSSGKGAGAVGGSTVGGYNGPTLTAAQVISSLGQLGGGRLGPGGKP